METGVFQRGRRPDDEEDEKEVHRLRDMVVEEVSLVDRAANRRKFLVVKRRTDMSKAKDEGLGPEVVQDEDGRYTAVRDVEKASGKAKDEEEDEDEEEKKKAARGGDKEDEETADEDEEDENGKPKGRKKADDNAAGNQLTIPAPV